MPDAANSGRYLIDEGRFMESMTGKNLQVLTLTSEVRGRRRALTGNYLDALLPRAVPGNVLVRARVKKVSAAT